MVCTTLPAGRRLSDAAQRSGHQALRLDSCGSQRPSLALPHAFVHQDTRNGSKRLLSADG